MTNTPETLSAIIAEMRDPENRFLTNNDLRDLADRIEAAAKREHSALSAPARNCDRFVNLMDAQNAFYMEGHRGSAEAILRWLFATAEGGAK